MHTRASVHIKKRLKVLDKNSTGRVSLTILLVAMLFILRPSYGVSIDEIVSKVQLTYDTIGDFQAHFVQESVVKSFDAVHAQRAEGVVYFKKKGKMFWDYHKPTPQQIISDGKTLWLYEPEEKQVTIGMVETGLPSEISADLLNGKANLKKDFTVQLVTVGENQDKNTIVLELTPKVPQPNVTRVALTLDSKTFQILHTEVYDLFDNSTRITFSQKKTDINLSEALFTFTPPPGVEILSPPSLDFP